MTEWEKLWDEQKVNLGGGYDYIMTVFRKGLKQIEIMREYNWDNNEYDVSCGMNIGTMTPEIIEDEEGTTNWVEMIQGDYDLEKEFASYEEALEYANKYMGEN